MNEEAKNMTIYTVKRVLDYCQACQELGPDQISGYKTHRNIPTDTWLIKITLKGREEDAESVVCADCLLGSQMEGINVLHNGEKLTRETTDMMFLRPISNFKDMP